MTRYLIAVLATLAICAVAYLWHEHKVSQAFEQGRIAEKAIWQEAKAQADKLIRDKETALRKTELERLKAEAEIIKLNASRDKLIEEALANEPVPENSENPECRCPPAVPRSLRDIIQNAR